MSIKKDKYYISLANNLAKNARGYTGPNPSVGAIVSDSSIAELQTAKESENKQEDDHDARAEDGQQRAVVFS